MTPRKNVFKRYLAMLLVMLITLGMSTHYAQALGIGGGTTINVNSIKYTITQKWVDKSGGPVALDTSDILTGAGKTLTYSPKDVDGYVYIGYYIDGAGNISNLQTGDPAITSKADGSDSANGVGAYTVYAVYSVDENNNKIPDDKEKYDITEKFVDANGNGIRADNNVTVNGAVKYSATAPSIGGYQYQGYFYTATKGGYAGGSLATPIAGNPNNLLLNSSDGTNTYKVTFVYKSTATQITISYNKNHVDALGTMTSDTAYSGTPAILSRNLYVRPGYAFDGWATSSSGPVVYQDRDSVTLSSTTILYAVWKEDPSQWASITFDKNASTAFGSMAAQKVLKNKDTNISTNLFSRSGYLFDGWATSPTGSKVYSNSVLINISSNVTLYAVWKEDPSKWATVAFNKNNADATGTMPNQKIQKDTLTALDMNQFALPGYTFDGWATSPTGSKVYSNGDAVNISADTPLYAVWKEDPSQWATIDFDKNAPDAFGTITSQKVLANKPVVLNANAFSRGTDYVFLGWSTTPNGTKIYDNRQEITPAGNMTLYAVWGTPAVWGDEEITRDKSNPNVGNTVNFSFEFGNLNIPTSTPWYNTVIYINLSQYLDGPNNFKLVKNGSDITPNYTYNFASKQVTLYIGDLNPGDTYEVVWQSTVLVSGQDKDFDVTYTGDGDVMKPLGYLSLSAFSMQAPKISGSASISVGK